MDPVFKRGTSSYNPDLDDADGTIVTQYYNCSEVRRQIHSVWQTATTWSGSARWRAGVLVDWLAGLAAHLS